MAFKKTKIAFSTLFLSVYCHAFSQNIYQTEEFEYVKTCEANSQLSQIPQADLVSESSLDAASQEYNISDILQNQFQYIFSIFQDNPPRLKDVEAPISCLIKIISFERAAIDTHILYQHASILDELLHQTSHFDEATSQLVLDFITFLNKENMDNI